MSYVDHRDIFREATWSEEGAGVSSLTSYYSEVFMWIVFNTLMKNEVFYSCFYLSFTNTFQETNIFYIDLRETDGH